MSRWPSLPAIALAFVALGLLLSRPPPVLGSEAGEAMAAASPAPPVAMADAASLTRAPVAGSANGAPAPGQQDGSVRSSAFRPPPEDSIPRTQLGQMISLGEEIFRHPAQAAPQFVGNRLACSNCHIDAGRLANASPLWAAWVAFPAYRAKNGHVNTFAERIQGCFRYSMNGKAPPLGDKVLVALESYSAWLARGAPVGETLQGRGYPKLSKPASAPDYTRGEQVYQQRCVLCHGADGAGQSAAGQMVFPALWGAQSYNWGAGMESVTNAAGFVKANMPLGLGGSLSDQDAWDVAMFMDSHERPQDPRFIGSVQETRERFHNSASSMYGRTVGGRLVGVGTGP
ncbi:c-type cytochrome [Rhodopila sp.]|uniref:c-type cytochrome n=1 Tax=Rhodopila sp. TaxID=2480087 RepID=UPI003D11F166